MTLGKGSVDLLSEAGFLDMKALFGAVPEDAVVKRVLTMIGDDLHDVFHDVVKYHIIESSDDETEGDDGEKSVDGDAEAKSATEDPTQGSQAITELGSPIGAGLPGLQANAEAQQLEDRSQVSDEDIISEMIISNHEYEEDLPSELGQHLVNTAEELAMKAIQRAQREVTTEGAGGSSGTPAA